MNRQRNQPPWEFLFSASLNTLQSYELSRLAHASDLRKEMTGLLDQWLEENACALLARYLMQVPETREGVSVPRRELRAARKSAKAGSRDEAREAEEIFQAVQPGAGGDYSEISSGVAIPEALSASYNIFPETMLEPAGTTIVR